MFICFNIFLVLDVHSIYVEPNLQTCNMVMVHVNMVYVFVWRPFKRGQWTDYFINYMLFKWLDKTPINTYFTISNNSLISTYLLQESQHCIKIYQHPNIFTLWTSSMSSHVCRSSSLIARRYHRQSLTATSILHSSNSWGYWWNEKVIIRTLQWIWIKNTNI